MTTRSFDVSDALLIRETGSHADLFYGFKPKERRRL